MERKEKIAVFPGTFNPFTIGHQSIVKRGLKIFDRIVIGIGCNPDKRDDAEIKQRICRNIQALYKSNDRVEATCYAGLTAEFVKESGACAILRGVRNVTDFEYERNLADINGNVLGVETVFLISLPECSYISSSMVRELESNGQDVSKFLASADEEKE